MNKSNKVSFNLYFIIILLTYFFSRLYVFLFLKVDFSYSLKDNLIQYLDFELLRSDLWTSLFYLHSQPPLFNFLIGLNEIFFGNLAAEVFSFFFNMIGLFTAILAFNILEKLGVNKKLAVFLIVIYIISPATILYENLFFYTHIIIFFLVFSAYHLVVYLQSEKFINAFLLFIGLTLAILTTSFFHLFWFLGLVLFLLLWKQINRARLIRAAILPFLIIFALYLKNYFVFGQFNTSSWLGLNLSRITVHQLDNSTNHDLIKKGHLSEFSAFAPFSEYKDLDSSIIYFFNNKTGIKVLDQTEKRNGKTNFNNYGYLKISQQMLDDDLYVVKNYPQTYLSGIYKAFLLYFDSPTKYNLLTLNTLRIKTFNKLFDSFIYGSSRITKTGYTSIIVLPIILMLAAYLFITTKTNNVLRVLIGFALINVLYVMFIGNFLEYGENNRFRYYTEIFSFLLLGIEINELIIKKIFTKKNNLPL